MKVKNIICYQIATNKNYELHQKLLFGKDANGQAKRVLNFSTINEKGRIAAQGFELLNSKKQSKNVLLNLCLALEESDFIIRELAFEHIRRTEFKKMPSRFHCLFLVDDRNVCLKNFYEFIKKDKNKKYQMVAMKLNGNIFYAKDTPISKRGLSILEHFEEARKYWSQNQKSQKETKEILFEGRAEVVEIIKQNY